MPPELLVGDGSARNVVSVAVAKLILVFFHFRYRRRLQRLLVNAAPPLPFSAGAGTQDRPSPLLLRCDVPEVTLRCGLRLALGA